MLITQPLGTSASATSQSKHLQGRGGTHHHLEGKLLLLLLEMIFVEKGHDLLAGWDYLGIGLLIGKARGSLNITRWWR